jgi:hypothetical protein
MTLRCTHKLLKRLDTPANLAAAHPDTVLGDWYANIYDAKPWPVVLCLNERTLLVVLLQLHDAESLITRFRKAVLAMLAKIDIPDDAIAAERRAMANIQIGRTANRRVVGCLGEAALAASVDFEWAHEDVLEYQEIFLSGFSYKATGYRLPRELARELFLAAQPGSRQPLALVH